MGHSRTPRMSEHRRGARLPRTQSRVADRQAAEAGDGAIVTTCGCGVDDASATVEVSSLGDPVRRSNLIVEAIHERSPRLPVLESTAILGNGRCGTRWTLLCCNNLD